MIGLIIIGAALLNAAFGFLGIPKAIAAEIAALGLPPFGLIRHPAVVLRRHRHVSGRRLDHRYDPAHHPAAGYSGGLRSDLVSGSSSW